MAWFIEKIFRRKNPPIIEPELQKSVVEAVVEEPTSSEAQNKAKELLEKLKVIEGKKGLVMIVDDSREKVRALLGEDGFGDYFSRNPTARTGYVISVHNTGQEAIEVYSMFRTAEEGNHHSVIVLMDGTLVSKEGTRKGTEVAEQMVTVSDLRGWPKPNFIGESLDFSPNLDLQKMHNDLYLGTIDPYTYLKRQLGIFSAIEAKFKV